MDAVILAGGLGTRLRGVVSDRPKPMATVAGRPFIEWLLHDLSMQGIRRVVLATGYKGDMIENHLGHGERMGMDLVYSREAEPRGTGGALRQSLDYIQTDDVLVLNGDSFCHVDADRLLQTHRYMGARVSLWLVGVGDCRRYGTVEVANDGSVTRFREKSDAIQAGFINAGVYLFHRRVLDMIPEGRSTSLERELFPHLIGRGLFGVVGPGPFLDIGTPESYRSAESFIIESPALWPVAS